jgi:CHAD domain-containing protein
VRPVTQARDAKVLVDTFDKIAAQLNGSIPSGVISRVRNILKASYEVINHRVLRQENAFRNVTRAMREVSGRLEHYPMRGKTKKLLAQGMLETYRKAYRAFAAANQKRTPVHLHEWRKQSKYLWQQIRLLGPKGLAETKKMRDGLRKLTDVLGDEHDLAVLSQTLRGKNFAEAGIPPALFDDIARRGAQLRSKALTMGNKLYRDKPRTFIARFATLV